MTATSINFQNRRIVKPGAYTEVDASSLENNGLGATGIVALIGNGIGGQPGVVHRVTRPETARTLWRSGDLREAAPLAFSPASDDAIPGGAQALLMVGVNQSTASSATLNNADGPAMAVTSKEYGTHTTLISVLVETGTNGGKKVTITEPGKDPEVFDDLGASGAFSLLYDNDPALADTMVVKALSGVVTADFTKAASGLSADLAGAWTGGVATLVSNNAADDGIVATVYGLDGASAPISEQITVNGGGSISGTTSFADVLGVVLSAALTGTLDVNDSVPATRISMIAADQTKGVHVVSTIPVTGILSALAGAGENGFLTLWGRDTSGAAKSERLQLTPSASTPFVGADWAEIDVIVSSEMALPAAVTVSGTSVDGSNSTDLQALANLFNSKPGFTMAVLVGNPAEFSTTLLDDDAVGTDVKGVAATAFLAVLGEIIDYINQNSQIVTASEAVPGTGAPSNTPNTVYLSGGTDGTATFADWQNALDKLKGEFVNTVVPLTSDPAVHAALKSHCDYMAGPDGRQERDGFVGVPSGTSKANIKAAIQALNTRHLRVVAQPVDRYDSLGVQTTYPPYMVAALLAGMQAGSPVGEPLTHKFLNVIGTADGSGWNAIDDGSEMIDSGLLVLEPVSGIGVRVLRNITAYLQGPNLAFVEGSVNEAINVSAYNFRTALESAVGKPGFAGNVNALLGVAVAALNSLIDFTLVNWSSLSIQQSADTISVSVEMSPVLPINFVAAKVHVVAFDLSLEA